MCGLVVDSLRNPLGFPRSAGEPCAPPTRGTRPRDRRLFFFFLISAKLAREVAPTARLSFDACSRLSFDLCSRLSFDACPRPSFDMRSRLEVWCAFTPLDGGGGWWMVVSGTINRMMLQSLVFLGATAWLVLSLGHACGRIFFVAVRAWF